MTLIISNSVECISSSMRVPPSFRSFDAMHSPKIVKLSLDVYFSLTSWTRHFKNSRSSSSLFSWHIFPSLKSFILLAFSFLRLLKCWRLNFCYVTATLWGKRSFSDSPSDWVKVKLFSTSVISSFSSWDIPPIFDLADLGLR